MAESVWALHCDPHLVRQLAVAAYCCVVVHFSLGCVHTSPTPAVDFTSSAQLSALYAVCHPWERHNPPAWSIGELKFEIYREEYIYIYIYTIIWYLS